MSKGCVSDYVKRKLAMAMDSEAPKSTSSSVSRASRGSAEDVTSSSPIKALDRRLRSVETQLTRMSDQMNMIMVHLGIHKVPETSVVPDADLTETESEHSEPYETFESVHGLLAPSPDTVKSLDYDTGLPDECPGASCPCVAASYTGLGHKKYVTPKNQMSDPLAQGPPKITRAPFQEPRKTSGVKRKLDEAFSTA